MKAILVVDMPTVCGNCKLEQYSVINHKGYSYCGACGISTKKGEILKECPLKPIHALKSGGKDYIIYERQYLYKNLEREYELMKGARDFDESNPAR